VTDRSGKEKPDNNYGTPAWLYEFLDDEFHFDFDPCPLNHNLEEWDGLNVEWGDVNFVNPPYDKIGKPAFVMRAFELWMMEGKTSVVLIPVATSTYLFHRFIIPYAEIRFLDKRIKFIGNGKGTGMHDNMIIIFSDDIVPCVKTMSIRNLQRIRKSVD